MAKRSSVPSFEEQVVKMADGCWAWRGPRLNGRGIHYLRPGKWAYAHRFAANVVNRGEFKWVRVLRCCGFKECVNPAHLLVKSPLPAREVAVRRFNEALRAVEAATEALRAFDEAAEQAKREWRHAS